jgi:hypothetical protein
MVGEITRARIIEATRSSETSFYNKPTRCHIQKTAFFFLYLSCFHAKLECLIRNEAMRPDWLGATFDDTQMHWNTNRNNFLLPNSSLETHETAYCRRFSARGSPTGENILKAVTGKEHSHVWKHNCETALFDSCECCAFLPKTITRGRETCTGRVPESMWTWILHM